ncbi:MAG: CDP-alcohol phosphatidyltransferase family protein [Actinomycetota bacterium]
MSAEAGPGAAPGLGEKKLDYFWTVLAVDPVAFPVVRFLARRRWLTPDQVTWASMAVGLLVGPAYLFGRAGLIAGAVLFYLSFVLDCVDGKLARLTGSSSGKGEMLDKLADGARRASAASGLALYLWDPWPPRCIDGAGCVELGHPATFWWAVAFGLLTFYFMEISGGDRPPTRSAAGGRLARALARRRLLGTPGMPDVAALVFVLGPLTGLVVPALVVGVVLVALAILRAMVRLAR